MGVRGGVFHKKDNITCHLICLDSSSHFVGEKSHILIFMSE